MKLTASFIVLILLGFKLSSQNKLIDPCYFDNYSKNQSYSKITEEVISQYLTNSKEKKRKLPKVQSKLYPLWFM